MSTTTNWVEGYVRAWLSDDPIDIRAIFTDDAEYLTRPFRDPIVGIAAIEEFWISEEEPSVPAFEWEFVAESDGVGVVRATTDYPGAQKYWNLWIIRFAEHGRASRFEEWWMTEDDD